MLAELNRTMAGVRFKVKFMVAVAPKSHAQIVKACGFLNSAFCYGLYSSTVRVVPARCRHKSVNHTFCSPISKYEVLPGIESEIGGIHMDMKAAGVVYFYVAINKYPTYLFKLFKTSFALENRANKFKSI